MPINGLSGSAGLLSVLRSEIAQRTEQGRAPALSARAPVRNASDTRAALEQALKNIACRPPPNSTEGAAWKRERMVRAILQWQFGAEVREHPEWHALVEAVDGAIARSPAAQAQFEALLGSFHS